MARCTTRWKRLWLISRALRIHRIGTDYSMTWSFAGPDGRALFRLAEVAGETVVVWLRVGDHGIYDS